MSSENKNPPTHYGLVLYTGFQSLDVFGPVDILNMLSTTTPLKFSIIAATLDPVSTRTTRLPNAPTIGQSVVPTHTFDNPPEDVEVLIVPGGLGARDFDNTQPVVEFVRVIYPKLRYLLTVCTGSAIVARSGILDGREATTNKMAFDWVTSQGPNVKWARHARWVTDGSLWTSSGISAGIDMMYAFVADKYGEDEARRIADVSEYTRNTNSKNDPFSKA